MAVTSSSAVFATAIPSLIRLHGSSREVWLLGVSLYVLGFAFGPIIFAPWAELKGRYWPFVCSLFGFAVVSIATGLSNSVAPILLFRFLGGFFGAGPLVLVAPIYADMFAGRPLGIAMVSFAFMVFAGPVISQPIGGFIVLHHDLRWRWTEYVYGIFGAILLVPISVVLKETYAPVILTREAQRLRKANGDSTLRASHEDLQLSWRAILAEYVAQPLKMLISDPIVLLMSLFGGFVYALLYLFLVGYPIVFQKVHRMEPGVGGLPYLGLLVGQVCAVAAIFAMQPWIARKAQANQGVMMPEWQLPVAVPGAAAFSIGILWFGWSGYTRSVHWIVPTLSGIFSGFGLLTTFVPSITYLTQARPERYVSLNLSPPSALQFANTVSSF